MRATPPSEYDDRAEGRTAGGHRFRPAAHALLRIGIGLLIIHHGVQKLFGWLGGYGGTPGAPADPCR
jgi:putative oxidoreductase